MTEYWVSKKQYYCKYCSIYIRDDAPSRKQHETGLKHIGAKERFIRDLYKGGERAKREKAEEAAEMARIEASAAAAYANDTAAGVSGGRPSLLQSLSASASTSSSRPARDSKPKDKFSNYSTAESLGFVDPDAQQPSYEVEQEIKGRAGEAGQWEEVVVPPPVAYATEGAGAAGAGKRPWEEVDQEHEEGEGWKLEHKKKAVHDPYDDDWDPKSLNLKVKVKEEKKFVDKGKEKQEDGPGALDRTGWTGKLELKPSARQPSSDKKRVYSSELGGWVENEGAKNVKQEDGGAEVKVEEGNGNAAGDVVTGVKSEPVAEEDGVKPAVEAEAPAAGSGMFKKRRPPPSSRKK
ncbi:hypothetical protein IAT38_006503 [Cryptococcus sp. DSM 104549]